MWDGVLCWPSTQNASIAEQPCPDYVNGFSLKGNRNEKVD